MDKRAVKGNQGDNSTADNVSVYKEIRPVKLDFSTTNFKAKVTRWLLSIEKKVDTLFPAVCDCACRISGITVASDVAQSENQDPQILAQANLASEDEDTAAEDEKDDTQATDVPENTNGNIDEDHHDKANNHHDNRADEDHNKGDNNGHDNGGDSRTGSKDGDNCANSKACLSDGVDEDDGNGSVTEDEDVVDGNSGFGDPNGSNDHHDEFEEEN